VFESDAGDVQYRDPRTGEVVPTDQNQHVVLRDPADNRLKVYARTPDTNEGMISSLGRVAMTGMAAGAPTARPGVVAGGVKAPSTEAIKGAARSLYKGPEIAGLEIKGQAVGNNAEKIMAGLNAEGFFDVTAPKTFAVLQEATKVPDGAFATGTNVATLYRALGRMRKATEETEREAARVAQESLKDFFRTVPPSDVIRGSPQAAARAFEEANANWTAAKATDKLDAKTYRAELRSAAANSGMNSGNTTRQRLVDILTNDKLRMGYKPEQLKLMEEIVYGTKPMNALRTTSNMLGGGLGMGAGVYALGAGLLGTAGSPLSIVAGVAPIVGAGLRKLGNVLTANKVNKLSELIRSESPLGKRLRGPVEEWSKATMAAERYPNPRNIAALTIASRNLSNNLRDAGISIPHDVLIRAIQGPIQGRPDDENR
jgi:hypothetical protein